MSAVTLGVCYLNSVKRLAAHDIITAELDARLLIEWASNTTPLDRLTKPDSLLDDTVLALIENALLRRINGEPTHRIIGVRGFYGLDFNLSPDTLEPRPDTETLIDLVLPFLRCICRENKKITVLDMGTGTGAIGVTLAAEIPYVFATGVDISSGALKMAQENAVRAGVGERFITLQSDWFAQVAGRYDLIVSNPPYIPRSEITALDITVRQYDPLPALDGGLDGLDFYRALANEAGAFLEQHGRVAVEIGQGQEKDVEAIFAKHHFRLEQTARDLSGIIRALMFVPNI